jgi:hypothetical protein
MIWSAMGVIVLGVCIALADIPGLLKENRIKDLWAVSLLLGTGLVMNAVTTLNLNVPSPLNWIKAVYEPIDKAILSILS